MSIASLCQTPLIDTWRHAAFGLLYASLTTATAISSVESTCIVSFPPHSATALAIRQASWPTASGSSAGDASQWTGSGSTGGDASQWTGAGGAGGTWDPSQFSGLFTVDLEAIRIAHACLAIAAMVVFFPFGGVIIRLVGHRHIAWFHAGVQMFAYTIFLAAAGLGIWMAKNYGVINHYHPILGMVILFLLSVQPLTEILNHFFFHRYPRAIILAHIHIWLGRIVITLGIVNGGLGFAFADTIPYQPVWSNTPKIVYAVFAGLVWIGYFAFCGVVQQVRAMRKISEGGAGVGEEGEEMEGLRGRASGGSAGVEEGRGIENGRRLDGETEEAARVRRASPLPTDSGFRSNAL